jgi:nucleotide-binding universal stress UspA family protein
MFRRVLIPTDGSPVASKTAKRAVAFAKSIGASVTVYHALPPASSVLVGDGVAVPRNLARAMDRANRAAAEVLVAGIVRSAKKAGVACESVITDDAPAAGILNTARRRKCDVIYIGTRGWGAIKSFLLGSVTQKVLSQSRIPVIVAR